MPDPASLEVLIKRLQHLEDERAILRTLYRYGHAIDYGEEARWADCFTEDGVFDIRSLAADGSVAEAIQISGRAALLDFVRQHPRAPDTLHKHLVVEPIIDIRGEEAQVASYFEMLLARGGRREIFTFGRYLDRLSRCDDGGWRFRERIAEIQTSGEDFPRRS